jgi:hypothetical protein
MKKTLATLWVIFMVALTLASLIAIFAGIVYFISNTIGWISVAALFGLGAGMTILFKITSWADNILSGKE